MREVYAGYQKSVQFAFPRRSAENLAALEMIVKHRPETNRPNVIEIGSNRGDLLYLLKERLPEANVLGLDPSDQPESRVPTLRALFSPRLFSTRFDVIILQHVLEHIKHPARLMTDVAGLLADNGLLYVEVPDLTRSLALRVEDFCLEHVNYFRRETLERALGGLTLVEADDSVFLRTVWRREGRPSSDFTQAPNVAADFQSYAESIERARRAILEWRNAGRRIIVFGVGYYFRMVYRRLFPEGGALEGLSFMDDAVSSSREPAFGLPRLDSPAEGDVVILCSNNASVQTRMAEKLSDPPGLILVRPWMGPYENRSAAPEDASGGLLRALPETGGETWKAASI